MQQTYSTVSKMIEKLCDTIEWEEKLPRLQYTKANTKHDGNQFCSSYAITLQQWNFMMTCST